MFSTETEKNTKKKHLSPPLVLCGSRKQEVDTEKGKLPYLIRQSGVKTPLNMTHAVHTQGHTHKLAPITQAHCDPRRYRDIKHTDGHSLTNMPCSIVEDNLQHRAHLACEPINLTHIDQDYVTLLISNSI